MSDKTVSAVEQTVDSDVEQTVDSDVEQTVSTCPSMCVSKVSPVLENKELSASELFRKAYEKQAKELEATLLPVFHVNINYIDRNASQQNYSLDIILSSTTCNGEYYILNWELLKNYALVATAKISNGQLILELIDHPTRIPLVDNYIHQVHPDEVNAIYNIIVSKKKMAI
jgi:hypothetical protein